MKMLLYLLICFLCTCSHAQERYKFSHFTTDEGLPSNTIYSITEDKNGNIVLGTDNGLTVFDGNIFKNYNVQDGLINPYITAVSRDKNNNIWFINYGAKLQKLHNDKIINTNISSFYYNSIETLNHKLFIYTPQLRNKSLGFSFLEFNDNKAIKSKKSSRIVPPILIQNNQEIKLEENFLSYQHYKILVPNKVKLIHKVIFRKKDVCILDENFLFILDFKGNILHQIKLPEALSRRPIYKYDFIVDQHQTCWLNIQSKGIFELKNNIWNNINETLGINNLVNTNFLYCDKNGKIWIATNENGLYCIADTAINSIQFTNQENYFSGFANSFDNKSLFVATKFRLYKYFNNQLEYIKSSETEIKLENFNAQPVFYQSKNKPAKFDKNLQLLTASGKQLIKIANNKYYVLAGNYNINIFDNYNQSFRTIAPKTIKSEKIKQVKFYKNQFYFNNSEKINIRTFDENYIYEKPNLKFKIKGYIEDFIFVKDTMWVATNNAIYKVFNEKIVDSITQVNNSKVDNIHRIKTIGNAVYLCAGNGLFKIEKNANWVLNKYNFLPNNDVYNVAVLDKELLVATKNGLAKIETSLLEKKSIKPIIQVLYNNNIANNIALKTEQEHVKIRLKIQNFYDVKNQIIQYQIDQSGWINCQDYTIDFNAIECGKHIIKFRVKDVNSAWANIEITVTRANPIYLEIGFILAMILFFINLLYAIYQYQIKKIKDKNRKEAAINNKIVELRQNALSAMMNPHFIFNSLNAIQYFVNSNQKEQSSEHLAKLSRLVRLFLSQAAEPFISLLDEINRLKLYVELEQVRFGNFNFKFNVDEKIYLQQTKIPNMIVQPFIENAILHGVSHLTENDGQIDLNFLLNQDVLTIEVIDNGFGLDADKPKNDGHISKGIAIITERIEILQETYPEKIFFIVQESAFANTDRKGHKVVIVVTILD